MKNKNYKIYYMPTYQYIPYDNINKLRLRKNNTVYYGELLGTFNNNKNIFSPASGIIKGTSKVQYNNDYIDSLVVENDYKDKVFKIKGGKEKFDIFKRKESNELLECFDISGKYNGKKTLVVDLSIRSDYLENDYITEAFHYELLQTIDALITIYSLKNAYIIINDKESKELLERYSGIYPNIKFKSIMSIRNNMVYYSGYELLRIYYALKFNKYLIDKYITIRNNKEITVLKTKINVLISDIIDELKISNFKSVDVITYDNKRINDYKGVLTRNIKTIIIL